MAQAVIFDLDDTLFAEADFVLSAYDAIERQWGVKVCRDLDIRQAFGQAAHDAGVDEKEIVELYRNHFPNISLCQGIRQTLDTLMERGCELWLVTDGRSRTQRNKIEALGLSSWFPQERILISEEIGADKLSGKPYEMIENSRSLDSPVPVCVGDNTAKDFVHPLRLGWRCVCLSDQGRNIHPQDFSGLEAVTVVDHMPQLLEILPE